MRIKLLPIFLLITNLSFSQENSNSIDSLAIYLNKASVEHKNLFLIFEQQHCGWCRVFNKYHNDKEVKQVLEKYYIVLNLDILETDFGFDLYQLYGKTGTPSWSIIDKNRKVLFDCELENKNIGYPSDYFQINYYILALINTSTTLSIAETDLLKTKLLEYNPKKKNPEPEIRGIH